MAVPEHDIWTDRVFRIIFWDAIDIFQHMAHISGFPFQVRGYQFILHSPGADNVKRFSS